MQITRRQRWLLIATTGVVLLVSLILLFTGSDAAERYKVELRAKGELIDWRDWTAHSTNGNPGYNKLLNAVAGLHITAQPPGDLSPMECLLLGHARVEWAQPVIHDYFGHTSQWSSFSAQMESNRPALLTLDSALQAAEPDWGWATTNMSFGPRVDWVSFRQGAQWLMGAALNDLHLGHKTEAAAHLHALIVLSEFHRDNPSLISQMMRFAIAGLGLSVTWESLQAPGWTEAQLARIQQDWERLDLLTAVETGYTGIRLEGVENFRHFRQAGLTNNFSSFSWPGHASTMRDSAAIALWRPTAMEDEFFFLQTVQREIEHLRLLTNGVAWNKVSLLLNQDQTNFLQANVFPKNLRHYLSSVSYPNYFRAAASGVEGETLRRLAVTAIALKRYELRHGKPAPALEALAPEFIKAVPIDCMDGKPLRYRLKADGTFLLYSIGEDGVDDGGDTNPASPLTKNYGIFKWRDAVWPLPETNGTIAPKP